MVARRYLRSLLRHRFVKGSETEAPILLPVVAQQTDSAAMIRFCRQICPGAALLLPDQRELHLGMPTSGSSPDSSAAGRIAALIGAALPLYGLSLVPVVVIGRGDGADLAVQLVLEHNSLLAAAILLRPTSFVSPVAVGSLNGMHVLLTCAASDGAAGSVGWQMRNVLVRGGALVVCERIAARRATAAQEVIISRVFLTTLFGSATLSRIRD